MENIFLHDLHKLLYFPSYGIYPSKVNMYCELKHHFAKIFFNIILKADIDFFVFAGSSIGLLRNGKNTPWVDDYDIIIFEENKEKLILNLFPILREYGFSISEYIKNDILCGYQIYSKDTKISDYASYFQCDIFLSKEENINNQKYIKNLGEWGLYHRRNVPINYVKPAKWYKFEDMLLPFFNNVHKDVELEYGDIFNTCVINVRHCPTEFIKDKWKKTYSKFYNYIKVSINNTKSIIKSYKNKYENRLILNNPNKYTIIDILSQISYLNVGEILVNHDSYLLLLYDIKFYYPNIKIITNNKNLLIENKYSLDLFDEILCDISDINFIYNYKIPVHNDKLSEINEVNLIENSKFSDFTLNNTFKYSKLTKKIITINGDSVFDLFIKNENNDKNKIEKKDNILNLNFTNKHYNFKDDEFNNKKNIIITKNLKTKKKIILKTNFDEIIRENNNIIENNDNIINSQNIFSNKINKISIYDNLKVIKPKYKLNI